MTAADQAASLIANAPCCAVLPAGAGKTEILASACGLVAQDGGRTLVLTHTNTGVAALRRRLVKLGVDSTSADIRTIAAWSLRWCIRYPILGEVAIDEDGFHTAYNTHYQGATRILQSQALSKVLQATWDLVVVDEYQDCTLPQHEIVVAISQSLPVVLVGDPLQSVYNFAKDPVVDWERDVFDTFGVVALNWEPHRWAGANTQLGADLMEVRRRLELGQPVDLGDFSAIRWTAATNQTRISAAKRTAKRTGTSLVITRFRAQSVKLARNTSGLLEALEDVAGEDLIKLAVSLDKCEAEQRRSLLLKFADKCISKLPSQLKTRMKAIEAGETPKFQSGSKLGPLTAAALAARNGEPDDLGALCHCVGQLPDIVIARREIWTDLRRTILLRSNDPELTYQEAARLVRSRSNGHNRHVSDGISATSLLVKGLEYDNVFVADADALSTEELYVAMTRACQYLEVSSNKPIIAPSSNRSR